MVIADAPGALHNLPGGHERVLLVEDDHAVRRIAARALRTLGYAVVDFPDAEAVLALADAELEAFDLLLTDIRLPGIDGGRLTAALAPRAPQLKTLLMSGLVVADLEPTLAGLPHKFLPKPFTFETLAYGVRDAIESARTGPARPRND
jgi:two-component system cell cycle sensor histidine kinase/response regulator CckA